MTEQITGLVFDIDHFAVHDGPGIRTNIYMKGCALRCQWCHSPESQETAAQILFAPKRCIACGECVPSCPLGLQHLSKDGIRSFEREKCIVCGKCVTVCPTGALFLSGKEMSVEDVMAEILPDKIFYDNSGGGVTISGGEVLMQPRFVEDLLKRLYEENIHTIVETSGFGAGEDLLRFADYADLFFYDFKLSDEAEFRRYIGGELYVVQHNLKLLRDKTEKIILRIPLIPEITDTQKNIMNAYKLAEKLQIKEIELLPYNSSAPAKYEWCGRKFSLEDLEPDPKHYRQLLEMAPASLHVEIKY